jgi:FkbM family methyltransferase
MQQTVNMRATHTCTNLLGQTITVFRDDYVGNKIAKHGLYEKENLALLLRLLEQLKEPVVLDIGANIGNHALAFATRAAQVHAFEPIPMIHAVLQQNVAQNALHNVQTHMIALSDTQGDSVINLDTSGNLGASSFDNQAAGAQGIMVHKRRGDDVVAELGLTRVDLVKIDVEAHEAYVLRGLMQTLQRYKPFITMEWNDPLTIERLRGSAELVFLQANYQIMVLGSNWDRGWWQGKPLAFLRRKFTRQFCERKALLHAFDPDRVYKNLLLFPNDKTSILDLLQTDS